MPVGLAGLNKNKIVLRAVLEAGRIHNIFFFILLIYYVCVDFI